MKDELQPSSSPPLSAPRRPLTLGTIAGLLVLAAVVLIPYLLSRQPAWLDEAIFSYMAQGPSRQHLPYYQAGYDNKPPGIYLLYQLTGAFDAAGLGRVRLTQGMVVLATCLVLLFWLRREASATAGWWAAALYALLLAFTPGVWALTEPPMALLSAAGFCLAYYGLSLSRWGYLPGAGLALGVAACFKQVALLDLLGLFAVMAVAAGRGRRVASVALAAVGVLACAGVVCAWMAVTGQFAEFWRSAVLSLLGGGAAAARGARAQNLLEYWRWIMPVIQVPVLLALLAYLAPVRRPLGLLLGVWLAAAGVGVASSGYFLNHQSVQFFAPLAALSGIGGAWLWRREPGSAGWSRAAAAATLTLLVFAAPADKYRIRVQQEAASHAQVGASPGERLGAWLDEHVPPHETIYVLGNGMPVYFYSQRRAPTRYFHTLLLSSPALQESALADLQAHPPLALVFAPDYYEVQRAFTAQVRGALRARYHRLPGDPAFPEYEVWWRNP
jgi:4-amino-4-deoxy-L-arabinose transferase-like glycosyltransferase